MRYTKQNHRHMIQGNEKMNLIDRNYVGDAEYFSHYFQKLQGCFRYDPLSPLIYRNV